MVSQWKGWNIMNKIQSVMKKYKEVFPNVELEQRGAFIRVCPTDGSGDMNSCYSNELLDKIYLKTGNMYEWDAEEKVLILEYEDTDFWKTGEPIHTTEPATAKQILDSYNTEENIFDEIGEV